MIDLSSEIEALSSSGALDPVRASRLVARERRQVFSIHPELRLAAWLGVMLTVTGIAALVAKNIDRIGPIAIAGGLGLLAVACYGYAGWRRRMQRSSLVDEFVLLLGALLLSIDVGYIEAKFHFLDHGWPRHFLILAILHGLAAYYFASRTLLSLSLVALASWLGVEQRVETLFQSNLETSVRAFVAAGCIILWRFLDKRFRVAREFEPVFEHFAANLALFGALALTFDRNTRWVGGLLTLIFAVGVILHGFRRRSEAFVIYAYVYGVIAFDVMMVDLMVNQLGPDTGILIYLSFIISTLAAIVGLFLLHARFRGRE